VKACNACDAEVPFASARAFGHTHHVRKAGRVACNPNVSDLPISVDGVVDVAVLQQKRKPH